MNYYLYLLSSINIILGENGSGKSTFMSYVSQSVSLDKILTISEKKQILNVTEFKLENGKYPTVQQLFYQNTKGLMSMVYFLISFLRNNLYNILLCKGKSFKNPILNFS